MIKVLSIEPFTDEMKISILTDMPGGSRHSFLKSNPNRDTIEGICDSSPDWDGDYWDLEDDAQEKLDKEFEINKITQLKPYLESIDSYKLINEYVNRVSIQALASNLEGTYECTISIQVTHDSEQSVEPIPEVPSGDFITFDLPKKRKKK